MGRVQDVILEDVKIGRSPLHFEPKRWTKPEHGVLNSNPLEAEHPTFVRALDFMCMGTDLGLMYAPAGVARGAAAGLGGLTSAGMAVWGVNKWQHGETALDRIEAVGSLALGAGYGLESLNVAVPLGGVGRNLTRAAMGTYAATDLFLGGVDAVRGAREKTPNRLVSGLAQMATGVCVAGMELFPGAAAPLLWGMIGSIVVREVAVGLPGEPLAVS